MLPRPGLGPVQVGPQLFEQNLVNKRGFSAPRHPGDAGEGPQGEGHVHPAQVVLLRAEHLQIVPAPLPPLRRNGDFFPSGEVVPGDRCGVVHDFLRGTGGHDGAAVHPRAGAHVDDIIRLPHGVLVVLHHKEGVAQVPQLLQGLEQLVVVPLVQANGGLVQDIEHPHEGGPDLGGQSNPLALAAGESARLPGEGEVLQAHRLEEAQAVPNFLQNLGGNHGLGLVEHQFFHKVQGLGDALAAVAVDVQPAHSDGQRLPLQPPALAGGAGALGHALLQLPLHGVGLGLPVAALQVVDNALEGLVQGALAPGLVVAEGELLPLGAVEDHVQHLVRQLLHRVGELEAVLFRQGVEVHPGDAVRLDVVPAGGGDGPL